MPMPVIYGSAHLDAPLWFKIALLVWCFTTAGVLTVLIDRWVK
jgi:hypothetical protein